MSPVREEIVNAVRFVPQDRLTRTSEQIVNVPVLQLQDGMN